MPGILVIDAGTTSFKVAIFDQSLRLEGLASREFEILRPATDRASWTHRPTGPRASKRSTMRSATVHWMPKALRPLRSPAIRTPSSHSMPAASP